MPGLPVQCPEMEEGYMQRTVLKPKRSLQNPFVKKAGLPAIGKAGFSGSEPLLF
jgi:hypothetical protein